MTPRACLTSEWGTVIIPCAARKLSHPAPACELYQGAYFRALRAAAEMLMTRDRRILSGKFGLLRWDEVIAPYEQRIDRPGAVSLDVVREQARTLTSPVLVLAGSAYANVIRRLFSSPVCPFVGTRGIGDQMRWLHTLTSLGHHREFWAILAGARDE